MGLFGNKTPKEEPLFESNYLGSWVKVYSNRVDFSSYVGFGSESVPINQIASVRTSTMGIMKITIETTGGKKYTLPTHKKQEVKQAIYDAQAALTKGNGNQKTDVADEIKKLNALKEEGILTQDEFDKKKKQLLGL